MATKTEGYLNKRGQIFVEEFDAIVSDLADTLSDMNLRSHTEAARDILLSRVAIMVSIREYENWAKQHPEEAKKLENDFDIPF